MSWEYMILDDNDNLYFEDGTKRPLQASDYRLTFGKYSGLTLEDITDEWYLGFLQKLALEKDDWFLGRCLQLRQK